MFITDPEKYIHQQIILMGGSIQSNDLFTRKKDLVSYEGQLLSFGATEGRHRVFVKYWYQEPDEPDSDEEPDPDWEEEKAQLQALRGYTVAPRTFGWTPRANVTIAADPSDAFVSAQTFNLAGNEGGQGKRAYLLPWHEEGVCWMQLGTDADYFFTDVMTGCTFGVGGDSRKPVVLHSNVGDSTRRAAQTLEHLKYVTQRLPVGVQASPVTLYGKERQYISDLERAKTQRMGFDAAGTTANIVGWREKGEWRFWSQRYMLYTKGAEQLAVADIVVEQIEY
ncbi:hypothetical protein JYJ95_15705 [Corallococcus exiguus]|uniref:hypothetical protein n=1 Tax=Corallococcus exiguus TaxID=83462 RepID=UPI001A90859A|nr:hypothetical protein [Corallococcus exiguus]MBN8467967.1 hypothetical protein [Corallococcus exiguus]